MGDGDQEWEVIGNFDRGMAVWSPGPDEIYVGVDDGLRHGYRN